MNQQFASKTICEYSFALPFFFFPQSVYYQIQNTNTELVVSKKQDRKRVI
jgi:hypothetical protein